MNLREVFNVRGLYQSCTIVNFFLSDQGSTLTFLATCPFGQVTKKLTCPNFSVTCQIFFFIKFKYCKHEKCIKVNKYGLCISYLLR
jgi:hypothetical protein